MIIPSTRQTRSYIPLILLFASIFTVGFWPFWYNHHWNGWLAPDQWSWFTTTMLTRISSLLLAIPGLVTISAAFLLSRQNNSKPTKVLSVVALLLFITVVILWIIMSLFIATHPPIGL